jgi:hypothetical protein
MKNSCAVINFLFPKLNPIIGYENPAQLMFIHLILLAIKTVFYGAFLTIASNERLS